MVPRNSVCFAQYTGGCDSESALMNGMKPGPSYHRIDVRPAMCEAMKIMQIQNPAHSPPMLIHVSSYRSLRGAGDPHRQMRSCVVRSRQQKMFVSTPFPIRPPLRPYAIDIREANVANMLFTSPRNTLCFSARGVAHNE